MTIAWDSSLRQARCNPELRNFVASGGRSGTGREQRVYRDAGFWEITYGEFRINDQASALAYRAMMARLRQGEEIVAKIPDYFTCQGQDPIRVVVSAPARATSIQIEGVDAELLPGHHFSTGNRLYRVTEITDQTEASIGVVTGTYNSDTWDDGDVWVDDPSIVTTLKFIPPLRSAVAANALVKFDDLKCICVLKDMGDGDLDTDLNRVASPSFTLIESI